MTRDLIKQPVTRREAVDCLLAHARAALAAKEHAGLDAFILSSAVNLCTIADAAVFNIAFNADPLARDPAERE